MYYALYIHDCLPKHYMLLNNYKIHAYIHISWEVTKHRKITLLDFYADLGWAEDVLVLDVDMQLQVWGGLKLLHAQRTIEHHLLADCHGRKGG